MAAEVEQVSFWAQYGSLIFQSGAAIIGFLATVIGGLVYNRLVKIDHAVFGDGENQGIVSDLNLVESQQLESKQDIAELQKDQKELTKQISEISATLTDRIITEGEKTSKEIRSHGDKLNDIALSVAAIAEAVSFLKDRE